MRPVVYTGELMSRRNREVEILLREWVRGVIGLEEWTLLGEDRDSREIDGMVPTDKEPNITNLTLTRLERPTAAMATMTTALKRAAIATGKASYKVAAKNLPKEPGEDPISDRTLRRNFQKGAGSPNAANKIRQNIEASVAKNDEEEREKPQGWDEDEDLRAEK